MNLKERLATLLPTGKKRRRYIVIGLLTMCMLLCGFIWDWFIRFTDPVEFLLGQAIDEDLILDFPDFVNTDDLLLYLEEPVIAEQITTGIQANMSAGVYNDIEIPDMTEESLGKKVLQIIFDRILK